jgi:manganese peroxidase
VNGFLRNTPNEQFPAHAVVTCPLGPTVKTFVGRPDRTTANPEGLLPNPHTDADTLIANMNAKGFSDADIAAILGAHSTAKQFEFDPAEAGAPLDDTPGIWDVVSFYIYCEPDLAAYILHRGSMAKF